jgi:hypothetical protein
MKNISEKPFKENQNTHIAFSTLFENRAIYEIMWENILKAGQATDEDMVHAHGMPDT